MNIEIHISITLSAPPDGVRFALQTKKRELEQVVDSTGRNLTFRAVVTMVSNGGAADFKGPHVNGPKGARFLYINSGEMSGQNGTCWSRRAKIHLTPLAARLSQRSGVVDASTVIPGTARDGGPVCASVKAEWVVG